MIRLTFFLFLLVCCLSIPLLAVDDSGISIEQIYEKSLSPDGKFAASKVIRGKETGLYIINTATKSLIGTIMPLSSNSIRNIDITATWNHAISNVALLIHYGSGNIDLEVHLEVLSLESASEFRKIPFNYPREIENNYEKSQKRPGANVGEYICGLGSWSDDNIVSLVAGTTSYESESEKLDSTISYLVAFSIHVTKDGKAELQKVKVIGSLTNKEYDAFVATHEYQF